MTKTSFKEIRLALRESLKSRLQKALAALRAARVVATRPITVMPREGYYLDGHGSVRRRMAKKPANMSARQYRKLKKDFRRQAKLHPGCEPANVGGRLLWLRPDVTTGEPLSMRLRQA